MIRAFVALPLPDAVRQRLNLLQFLLPLPRRVAPENLHLTLAFLGEVPGHLLEDAHHALEAIRAAPFALSLAGVGSFGGSEPRAVYAGVAPAPALEHLQRKVATALRRAGIGLEKRRFTPHVTLARLNPERLSPQDRMRLSDALAANASFSTEPFQVEAFALYRSHLGGEGAHYEELARYPLAGGADAGLP